MKYALSGGTVLTVAGVAGYVIGVFAPYPGRSVSIAGIMAGITLSVIGLWGAPEGAEP